MNLSIYCVKRKVDLLPFAERRNGEKSGRKGGGLKMLERAEIKEKAEKIILEQFSKIETGDTSEIAIAINVLTAIANLLKVIS